MGNGASWLTYMFESKDTSEFRNFQFGNMHYKVSHLEQQIKSNRWYRWGIQHLHG